MFFWKILLYLISFTALHILFAFKIAVHVMAFRFSSYSLIFLSTNAFNFLQDLASRMPSFLHFPVHCFNSHLMSLLQWFHLCWILDYVQESQKWGDTRSNYKCSLYYLLHNYYVHTYHEKCLCNTFLVNKLLFSLVGICFEKPQYLINENKGPLKFRLKAELNGKRINEDFMIQVLDFPITASELCMTTYLCT